MRKRIVALTAVLVLMCACAVPGVGLSAEETSAYLVVDNGGLPKTAGVLTAENGLDAAHGRWAVVSDGETALGPGEIIATGQTLRQRNIEGGTLEEVSIAVAGDVTGTGMAGIDQVVRLIQALSGTDPLEGVWLAAGDMNGSGAIDIADVLMACEQLQELGSAGQGSLETAQIALRLPEGLGDELPLTELAGAYADGQTEVPYITAGQAGSFLEVFMPVLTRVELKASQTCDGMISVWMREDGSCVEINYLTGDVLFSEMSQWALSAGAGSIVDVVASTGPDAPFERTEATVSQTGAPVLRNLYDYNIPLYYADGEGYLPLATFSDLCMSPLQCPLACNGEACFLCASGALADMEDDYYAAAPRQRSAELAEFTYEELCFALDLMYGLKENHRIDTFDAYLDSIGLAPQLLSQDPVTADTAMYSLLRGYLGDNHCRYMSNSSYAGRDADCTGIVSPSVAGLAAARERMQTLRAEQFPDGVPAYQEVGDTAFITFDSFVFAGETYTSETLPDANDPSLDTMGLITYANEQIRRPDSPITKVVLDLSCNTGGEADAAVFTASWFLGTAPVNVLYTTSGAQASTVYQADISGNGVFGEPEDTISDLDLYCLISEVSFSSGNLVPAIFKNSERVTILGRQSHGGACAVEYLAAADGTMLRISSPIQLSWLHNGSFYDIDQGVTPDVPITVERHYYDRGLISGYLGSLLR